MTASNFTQRQVRAVAVMTILGLAMFAVILLRAEPDWTLWFFGGLMVLSALAFWTSYLLQRRRQARRDAR
ncbi:hypothetical protein [Qaidamihabitans albus]|uniref:hypothetical protein n=1 Tax=Qaidamihabitans albus TaxID=2795733 RepID=UPI0018F19DD9|nr:hypothetical protein [Qaidamihabitans albus]